MTIHHNQTQPTGVPAATLLLPYFEVSLGFTDWNEDLLVRSPRGDGLSNEDSP